MKRLTDLFAIRPAEARMAGLIVALMLLTALGSGIGTSGVEALFFARLGTSSLPIIYMAQGVLTLVITLAVSGLVSRLSRNTIYLLLPLSMTIILVGERLLSGFAWFLPVMWLLKEIVNSLLGLYVWGVAGALCDTRQAKRLFPLFNAGRILGSVFGGLVTAPLVNTLGTENLLWVWAGAMAIAVVLTRLLLGQGASITSASRTARRSQQPSFIQEMQQGFQFVRGSALMIWVSIAAVLFSALYFSLALPFSKAATAQFPNEAALAGFLGLFQALSTAGAFVASLFVANRFYARFGVMSAILALPLIYVVGFGVLAVYPAFPVLVVYKFVQMLWLSGMADSAYQAMFNAVPGERRDQVRAFVDGVPSQAGTFIAGFILIVGEQSMDSQQLYFIGLGLGVACTYVIWQATRAYSGALIAALRAGQPLLFVGDGNWDSVKRDATAISTALAGLNNSDPTIRRVSAEILGSLSVPEAAPALLSALPDPDPLVRASALKSLANSGATTAVLQVAACLNDPDPDVRVQALNAVSVLLNDANNLKSYLHPLLDDPAPQVRAQAAVALLRCGPHPEALSLLRQMASLGELEERIHALTALGDWGDREALTLIEMELEDEAAPAPARKAAAHALRMGDADAVPSLVQALSVEDRSVREAAADSLATIGVPALEATTAALFQPATEHGAIHALEQLPNTGTAEPLRRYARDKVKQAVHYHTARTALGVDAANGRLTLLGDSLRSAAQWQGLHALRAANLLGNDRSLSVVMENLVSRDAGQRANALETLESVPEAALLKPMLAVWEEAATETVPVPQAVAKTLTQLLAEPNPWLRACTVLVVAGLPEPGLKQLLEPLSSSDPDPLVRQEAQQALRGDRMNTLTTLSLMERIMFLKRVPLFADLPPADIKQVAAIAGEMLFANGDYLAEQGEVGNEMFVIVAGEVGVRVKSEDKPETEIARRKSGDFVGEMAIISQEPRIASLTALGDVRTLCIDRKSFEGLLRERPEVCLAVLRVICGRLKELSH